MKQFTSVKRRLFASIPALLLLLLISACANGASGSGVGTVHTPVATSNTIHTPTPYLFSHPVVYVALGASDAVGVGSNEPGAQGYVPLLAARLPKGSHAINLGVSGIHLHEALSAELPLALTTAPDLITIWLVANDFVAGVRYDDYIHDLNSLLQQIHTTTHARTVMANLPDLTLLPAFANRASAQKAVMRQAIQHWNAGIAATATRYGVLVIDLFSHYAQLTAHPEYISADGFHPSPAGYVQLANFFWQAIQG